MNDLGKVLLHPSFGELPQWVVVGDTYPVGCAFDESIVHHKYFKENPDYNNLFKFKTLIVAFLEEEVEEDHFVVEDKEEEMCQVKIQAHSKEEEEDLVEVTMEEGEEQTCVLNIPQKQTSKNLIANQAEDMKESTFTSKM
ncbi:hypothetical protein POM88_047186 [Heracleum sosnowskyi]|uniref:Inositol oxygenase n=1 Tax=Heracleum sosnowskyi TaxID=360622 RepID=A0AAD8HAQ9_9APIA|nr:hypothetical protein POM88_047186 [Heracleum sosnowskyi]